MSGLKLINEKTELIGVGRTAYLAGGHAVEVVIL